jgi:hypothetical protein
MKLFITTLLLIFATFSSKLFSDKLYTISVGTSIGRTYPSSGCEPFKLESSPSNLYGIGIKNEFFSRNRFSCGINLEFGYTLSNYANNKFTPISYDLFNSYSQYDSSDEKVEYLYKKWDRYRYLINPFVSLNNLGKFNIQLGIPFGYSLLNVPKITGSLNGNKVVDIPSISSTTLTFGLELEFGYKLSEKIKLNLTNSLTLSGNTFDHEVTKYNNIDNEERSVKEGIQIESGIISYNVSLGVSYQFDFTD